MKRRATARLFVIWMLIAVLMVPSLAMGWWDAGHRIVGLIAYERMSPNQRLRVFNLLKEHPNWDDDFMALMPSSIASADDETKGRWVFGQAAIWPDLIRPNTSPNNPARNKFHRGDWHFINLPLFLRVDDREALEGSIEVNISDELPQASLPDLLKNKHLNVLQALRLCTEVADSEDATREQKAVAICWLFHLVGDTHQPLHGTALFTQHLFEHGDQGGNFIKTVQRGSLHKFWDGLLGDSITFNHARLRAVELLHEEDMAGVADQAAQNLDFASWAKESLDEAKSSAYVAEVRDAILASEEAESQLSAIDLSLDYRKKAGKVAAKRVLQGGSRLAALLATIGD